MLKTDYNSVTQWYQHTLSILLIVVIVIVVKVGMGADSGGVIYNKEKRTLYSMLRKIPFKHLKKQSLWCHISMKCRVGAVESCSSSTSIPLLYGSFEKEGVPCTKNSLPFKK